MLARRDDDIISRYFEEKQRSQRAKGPEIYVTNFCSRGLVTTSTAWKERYPAKGWLGMTEPR